MRYFVTGTDTDVGKTRVTAALAAALVQTGHTPTIVKPVQTGLPPNVPGDAAEAAALAGCAARELARYALPADPWSAALAENATPPTAATLAAQIDTIPGDLIIEGAGGIAVPLNATETLADLAAATQAEVIVAVGLRLGCINHTLTTLLYARTAGLRVVGVVLVERWRAYTPAERDDITRPIARHARILGLIDHDPNAHRSVAQGAAMLSRALALTPLETAVP
jgi:dethiobiotin synthase